MSRRRVLKWGMAGVGGAVAAAAGGLELVLHDVLPGHTAIDRAIGGCDVTIGALTIATGATATSGQFFSQARNRSVGYTVAYPPGHAAGEPLGLLLVLHGFGRDHTNPLSGLSLAQAAGIKAKGAGSATPAPVALVAADGGNGYWHRHGADDPLRMLTDELIPMCQSLGLGATPRSIGALGISMGAFGALVLAERNPGLLGAVAAISPAVWRTYGEARSASPGAFASADDFAAYYVLAHAPQLGDLPVWVAAGKDDPFHPGVTRLAAALPGGATVRIVQGCHDDNFWQSQQPDALAFLAGHTRAGVV